jgi:hypothetical protein
LLIEADDHLRLERAVPQARDDGLLNFRYGSRGGGNLAGVGNIDVTPLINGLGRQIDEVAGTSASGLSRREQATSRNFKDRYIEDVTNTDDLVRLRPLIGEFALESDQIGLRQQADRIGRYVDQRIRQGCSRPHTGCRISVHGFTCRPGARK